MWLLPQCTKEVLKTSRTLWLSQFQVCPSPRHLPGCVLHFPKVGPPSPGGGSTQQSLIRTYTGTLRPEDQPLTLLYSGGSRGRVRGVHTSPIKPYACLRLKFLHRRDCISLFNWLIFLMKLALHFATKLNSRIVQKCNCFWVSSYDLFTSARKAVFAVPTATGVLKLKGTVLWYKIPSKAHLLLKEPQDRSLHNTSWTCCKLDGDQT